MPATYLIVLTATIFPAPSERLKRNDPKIRLEDYKSALRFWLLYPHPKLSKVLFLENSGADLSELEAIYARENLLNKEVEFISMNGNQIPKGLHYGYGEMQMLDHGLRQSRLREQTTHMIKVTGRLTFPAIGKLLNRLPEDFEACVECRIPLHSYRWGTNPLRVLFNRVGAYTSSQLMIFSHAFYRRELQGLYLTLVTKEGSTLIENLIYPQMLKYEGKPGVYLRWPINIDPVGVTGHSNVQYGSMKRSAASLVRRALRVVAPNWWL